MFVCVNNFVFISVLLKIKSTRLLIKKLFFWNLNYQYLICRAILLTLYFKVLSYKYCNVVLLFSIVEIYLDQIYFGFRQIHLLFCLTFDEHFWKYCTVTFVGKKYMPSKYMALKGDTKPILLLLPVRFLRNSLRFEVKDQGKLK